MRLVLASNNAKKLVELRGLFAALPLELVPQHTLGITEAGEPHHTFVENALAKARHAARACAGAAIADDSGLCVDALGGEPGVASAHFSPLAEAVATDDREALRRIQDAANNRLLLQRLEGHQNRRARFVSALVAIRSADDPEPLIAFGRWHGEILTAPRGDSGFGYDPLVYIPSLDATVAQLAPATKNAHSHRALAACQMLDLMAEAWRLSPSPASGRGQG